MRLQYDKMNHSTLDHVIKSKALVPPNRKSLDSMLDFLNLWDNEKSSNLIVRNKLYELISIVG